MLDELNGVRILCVLSALSVEVWQSLYVVNGLVWTCFKIKRDEVYEWLLACEMGVQMLQCGIFDQVQMLHGTI